MYISLKVVITSFQSGPKGTAEINVEEFGINVLYRNRDLVEIRYQGRGTESSLLFSKIVSCIFKGRGC